MRDALKNTIIQHEKHSNSTLDEICRFMDEARLAFSLRFGTEYLEESDLLTFLSKNGNNNMI